MEQIIQDRILKKAILFSCITAVSTVIWIEVLGMELAVFIILTIAGLILRRWTYGKRL